MAAAVPASIRLGRRQPGNRRLTRVVHAAEVLLPRAHHAAGASIEHFRLYDQNGMPATNVAELDDFRDPHGIIWSRVPVDRDVRPVPNGFPRDTWLERHDGTIGARTPSLAPTETTLEPTTETTAPG